MKTHTPTSLPVSALQTKQDALKLFQEITGETTITAFCTWLGTSRWAYYKSPDELTVKQQYEYLGRFISLIDDSEKQDQKTGE